jgi:hypothetical protein
MSEGVNMGLGGWLVGALLWKKMPPAWEQTLATDRYDVSLWTWRYMMALA